MPGQRGHILKGNMPDQKRSRQLKTPGIGWPASLDGKVHTEPQRAQTRLESVYSRPEMGHARPEIAHSRLEIMSSATEGPIPRLGDPLSVLRVPFCARL